MKAATRYYTEKCYIVIVISLPFTIQSQSSVSKGLPGCSTISVRSDVIAGLKIVLQPCVVKTKQSQAMFLNLWPRAYHFSPYSPASRKRTVNDFNYNPINFFIEQIRYVYDNKASKIDCNYLVGGKESHLYPQCNCASE